MIYRLGEWTPECHDDTWVADNATVVGRVKLAAGVSIWFNAVLRGDGDEISVGENSNIQDGSVLHVDPGSRLSIGPNVTVGHKVMLHGLHDWRRIADWHQCGGVERRKNRPRLLDWCQRADPRGQGDT